MGVLNDYPRLCGGTFFILLTRAMKKHGRGRDGYGSSQAGITEANLLKDLIRVFYPSYPDLAKSTEKSNASKYKQGKNLGVGFPGNDTIALSKFDHSVKNEYKKMLISMNELVLKYLDVETYGSWLVKALLQLIEEDETIPGDAYFYLNTVEVKKENLDYVDAYVLPGVLLGVWHYIIMQVRDNTVGKRTYAEWFPDSQTISNGTQHEFISSIGTSAEKHIVVKPFMDAPEEESKVEDDKRYEVVLSREYKEYIESARGKYTKIKTILHDELKPFRDFYVCNGLTRRMTVQDNITIEQMRQSRYIDVPTADKLAEYSNYIVIVGTGGLGKSMMMQHLMLDTLDRCDEIGRIPIFIYLKDYTSSNREISEFVFEQFQGRYPQLDRETFNRDLTNGRYVLLFDGMDEINSSYRGQFETRFDLFADANSKNLMIISSRPFSDFLNLKRFSVMMLRPFTKDKALDLIDKLDFREDEPELKQNFRDDLNNYLFDSHREFAQNPLLLTFMLMTYERFGPVSRQMHAFYSDVYDLLAKRHDATKVGYSRKMKTGLSPERLKEIFAAFCASTYQKQAYSFTESELIDEFSGILGMSRNENEKFIPPAAFIEDYTSGICLMYRDGDKYFFMHRSFQEYFCALAFSKQLDENLLAIGDFFEHNDNRKKYRSRYGPLRLRGDQTFDMLYEMITDRVEKFILLPYLKNLFEECDKNDGFWTFMQLVRPWFRYEQGDTEGGYSITTSPSFLYSFIIARYGAEHRMRGFSDRMPFYEEFVVERYVEVEVRDEDGTREWSVMDLDAVPSLKDKDPEIVGWSLSVDVADVWSNPDDYKEMIETMERPDFPYMMEYNETRQIMEKLQESANKKSPNLITII